MANYLPEELLKNKTISVYLNQAEKEHIQEFLKSRKINIRELVLSVTKYNPLKGL